MQYPSPTLNQGTFAQFIFDNFDFNVNTIDGFGTFYNMFGIMCVTPADSTENPIDHIVKQQKLSQTCIVDKKGLVEVMEYTRGSFSSLDEFSFKDLDKLFSVMT